MRSAFVLVAASIVAMAPWPATGAEPTGATKRHTNWVRPDVARFQLARIALMPVATYDLDPDAEASIDAAVMRALASKDYQWVVPGACVESLAAEPAGSPMSAAVLRDTILATRTARIDSLVAPELCARLDCDAVMSVRVEGEATGSPWMKGALVARDGSLLWTADRDAGTFVGRTRDPASRRAAQRAAAQSWVGGLYPILDRWAMDFPKATPAR